MNLSRHPTRLTRFRIPIKNFATCSRRQASFPYNGLPDPHRLLEMRRQAMSSFKREIKSNGHSLRGEHSFLESVTRLRGTISSQRSRYGVPPAPVNMLIPLLCLLFSSSLLLEALALSSPLPATQSACIPKICQNTLANSVCTLKALLMSQQCHTRRQSV